VLVPGLMENLDEPHPALDQLVRQFVVIGMPDRYQSATLTRLWCRLSFLCGSCSAPNAA